MSESPLVSVIIPTHYRNDSLEAAMRSVQSQTHTNVELVVVDDSGDRHAEDVVSAFDATYVPHERNSGANAARTTGFRAANGEYVQFLDDDDRLYETKLERQLAVIAAEPAVGVVYCGIMYEKDGLGVCLPVAGRRGDVLNYALQFDLNPCQTGTMLVDASVLESIMPLADRAAADDIGMKIRLADRTQFEFVDEVLFRKGDVGDHRAETPAFADELERMIRRDFASLYERAPDHVSRTAMYRMYRMRGFKTIRANGWSPDAIRAFGAALRYSDPIGAEDLACVCLSLFGQPGISFGSAVRSAVERDTAGGSVRACLE